MRTVILSCVLLAAFVAYLPVSHAVTCADDPTDANCINCDLAENANNAECPAVTTVATETPTTAAATTVATDDDNDDATPCGGLLHRYLGGRRGRGRRGWRGGWGRGGFRGWRRGGPGGRGRGEFRRGDRL